MKRKIEGIVRSFDVRFTKHLASGFALLLLMGMAISSAAAQGKNIPPTDDGHGHITWGPPPYQIRPTLNFNLPGTVRGGFNFEWTDGLGAQDPNTGYQTFHKSDDYQNFGVADDCEGKNCPDHHYSISYPDDPKIKDWTSDLPEVNSGLKAAAFAYNGGLQQLRPIGQLPKNPFLIPQLAPPNGGPAIYTAVDLLMYMTSNPEAFGNGDSLVGQTLADLGLTVVNGQILGIAGIYFSTSPFEFDPNSSYGFVPSGGPKSWLNSGAYQAAYGPVDVAATVGSTPEPSSLLLLGSGILGLSGVLRKRPINRS